MDIPRAQKPNRRKYVYAVLALAGVVVVTVALSRLEPAAPTVDRATLWIDSVVRGTMVRRVRAPGTLVSEQIRWIPAQTAGRVEQIHVRPGQEVTPETVLLELVNPDVQLEGLAAQQQLTAAQAALISLETNLSTQRLNQEGVVGQVRAEMREAARNDSVMQALDARGLASTMEVTRARERAEELRTRLRAEEERLRLMTSSVDRQLALQRAQIRRLEDIARFQEQRLASMHVKAGAAGVLQEMNWELGQWINPGAMIARVSQPGNLKAELRVPETQAKDIVVGQPAAIDTRNGIVDGRVSRIDPAVQQGTVQVEIVLEGALPQGARPDMSVDGTIEIERLDDVLYTGRPAIGQAESTVSLFKLEPDGRSAVRVQVGLGAASVNTIVVRQGLQEGDRVIISDMSAWDSHDRIRVR